MCICRGKLKPILQNPIAAYPRGDTCVQHISGKEDWAFSRYLLKTTLRAATRVDPTFADAWYNLSDLLDKQGRSEVAIECLRTTLRVAPDYADAMFNLALLLQRNKPIYRSGRLLAALSRQRLSIGMGCAGASIIEILRDADQPNCLCLTRRASYFVSNFGHRLAGMPDLQRLRAQQRDISATREQRKSVSKERAKAQGTDGNSAVCFSAQQTARVNQKSSRLIPFSVAQQFLAQRI